MGGEYAHEGEGDGGHDRNEGGLGFEPAHHKNEYENEHRGKGNAHVAEDFVGHIPLAVPFERDFLRTEGLGGGVLLNGVAPPVSRFPPPSS